MKFGEFAKINNITKDTLRYYMKIGLILPSKSGGNYIFTESDQKDIEFILDCKDFGFSVDDINKLISLKRNLHPLDHRFNNFMASELDNKKELIKNEIKNLQKKLDFLNNKSDEYLKNRQIYQKLGVAVDFLKNLSCPSCGSSFNFTNADIEDSYIIHADLHCKNCSYHLKIEDGIIIEDNLQDSPIKIEDLPIKENHEYWLDTHLAMEWKELKNLKPAEFQKVFKAYNWMYERIIDSKPVKNNEVSCIMTSETNSGRFLFYHLLNKIGDDNPIKKSTLIVAMRNIKAAKKLKNLLESLGVKLDIAIICASIDKLPISNGSVNIFLDDYSSFYYLLREKKVLLDDKNFNKYLSSDAEVLGILPKDFFILHKHLNMSIDSSPFLNKLYNNPKFIITYDPDNNIKQNVCSLDFTAYHYDFEGRL